MTSPIASVQVSINSGAWVSGLVVAPAGATVDFRNNPAAGVGIRSYTWEIPDEMPALTLPGGWSSVGGVFTSSSATPTTVTLPSPLGSTSWGKLFVRLRLNGNPYQYDDTGALSIGFDSTQTDESTMVVVVSPNLGLHGLASGETTQEDLLRAWVGAWMHDLRILEQAAGGASPPIRLTGPRTILSSEGSNTWYLDSTTAGFQVKLPDNPGVDRWRARLLDGGALGSWGAHPCTVTTVSGVTLLVDPNSIGVLTGTGTNTTVSMQTRWGGWEFEYDLTAGFYRVSA